MRPTRLPLSVALRVLTVLGLAAPALAAGPSHAPSIDSSPPSSPVKLVFIHHSTGENWLADGNGGLGLALRDNNYFVSDTNYGWGPDGIGDTTDIGHWWTWFAGSSRDTYTAALYAEFGQHSSYSRLAVDPGGANEIVMFKSCFPNSALGGSPSDPPTTGTNPLRGQGAGSEYHTVGNAKGIYNDILTYFQAHQEKLFIVIAAPPLAAGDTSPEQAANARAFNDWLRSQWLASYPYENVAVFDFYNVLTSNGGNADTNDLGWETGNHHRVWNGAVQYLQTVTSNLLAYPTGDSHPSRAGNLKASGEFAKLLNVAYHAWKAPAFSPAALAVDGRAVAGSTGDQNRVLEPGETVPVEPAWHNGTTAAVTTAATASGFGGPAGAVYTIVDSSADYGTTAPGATSDCFGATGDCYLLSVSDPTSRPATHWDATFSETLAVGGSKTWTLHVGESFSDVPRTNPFYRFVETLLHRGITGGCSTAAYCPSNPTTREQMAVFVLVAKEGQGYAPPACTTPLFPDVPASSPFCRWVEELARRGVVSGCGGGSYCPTNPVTREQMAIFVLHTLDPALNPPACTTPIFADVPASSPFCRWIEELANRGVVSGCGGGNYCPTDPVTREQMGVFISASFALTPYGP